MDWKGWVLIGLVLVGVGFIFLTIVNVTVAPVTPLFFDPTDEAVHQLNSRYVLEGALTTIVTFTPDYALRSASIVSKTGISDPFQVCISAGDFSEDPRFIESGAGSSLLYQASGNQRAHLSIICDKGNQIRSDIEEVEEFFGLKSEWFVDSCSEIPACDADSEQTCCFIAVRAT